jgi:trans-2,3-dihydro-3-hydroxyanthranilate isomerase
VLTVVNACLRDGVGGSPTAVLDESPMPDAERRAVPGSVGASHAVFVAPDNTLRFFTSEGELPACGHGTVAALALLTSRSGRPFHQLRVGGRTFHGRALPRAGGFDAAFDPGPISITTPMPDISAMSGGLGAEASGEIRVATLGRPRLLFPVAGRSEVAALRPDFERLRALTDRLGLLGCYVYATPDADGRTAARMFAPSIGVPEDIANANSTACLAAHLRADVTVDMGDSLGRPATVTATWRPDGVLVGGTAAIKH